MRVMAIHRIFDFKNTKCFCFLLFLASTFWNMEFFLVYWLLLLSLERSISEVTLEQMSSLFGSFSILPSKGETTGMKKKFEHMIRSLIKIKISHYGYIFQSDICIYQYQDFPINQSDPN
ncbi:hypothetical protein CIPAW_09G115100 [Carya illinoinensis]|uniref:Uncharacterized protein n=1 Tax=Carya illinoinensis TaxID=32201 RepID=A0A8T1PJ73_CARIL|nr:hypothetical protein CIPAW_09G115100 [Carya illinoinensis]